MAAGVNIGGDRDVLRPVGRVLAACEEAKSGRRHSMRIVPVTSVIAVHSVPGGGSSISEHRTAHDQPHSGGCVDSAVEVEGNRDRALAAALLLTKSGAYSARRFRRCGRLRLRAQRWAVGGPTLLPVAIIGMALRLYAPAAGEHPQ